MQRVALIIGIVASAVLLIAFVTYPKYPNNVKSPQAFDNVSASEIIISSFQHGHGFIKQSSSGEQTDDQSDFVLGQQSMRIETDGHGTAVSTMRSNIIPPIDFNDKVMKVWIKVSDTSQISELGMTVSGDNFRTYKTYWIQGGKDNDSAKYLRNNEWNQMTISPSQTSSFGSPNLSQINSVQINIKDRAKGPVSVWLNGLSLAAKNSRGILTFTFDDGYDTTYTKARSILDKYHFPATAFIVTGKVGMEERMTLDQLTALQNSSGWDISAHTVDHANLTTLSSKDIETELASSKEFLLDHGFLKGSDHFAYPYGSFDSDAVGQLVEKYYRTARTTRGSVETLPPSDPYRLRAMVVANYTDPDTVLTRVQDAMANGDWLILVFHRIVDSNADAETKYLKSDFEKVVEGIQLKGINVMTISDVYNGRYS